MITVYYSIYYIHIPYLRSLHTYGTFIILYVPYLKYPRTIVRLVATRQE